MSAGGERGALPSSGGRGQGGSGRTSERDLDEVATPVRSLAGGLLRCPSCRRLTASLKRYRLFDLMLYVGCFWFARTATHTACPGCMRGLIVRRTLVNIVTANILWPFVVLPLHTIDLLRTFTCGRSRSVVE